MTTEIVTAKDIIDVLARKKWPDSDYLLIQEAPQDSSRQGRRADLLVVALWQSRGLQRDVVEIKVSLADWRKEVKSAEKADWWFHHANRFWVAVPARIATAVREELPMGWGLLSCTLDSVTVLVSADRSDAEPFTWPQMVGLLRAAADAGVNALNRARSDGYQEGRKAGLEEAKARLPAKDQQSIEKVNRFEEITGIDLASDFYQPRDFARMCALALNWAHSPDDLRKSLQRLDSTAKSIQKQTKAALDDIVSTTTLEETS